MTRKTYFYHQPVAWHMTRKTYFYHQPVAWHMTRKTYFYHQPVAWHITIRGSFPPLLSWFPALSDGVQSRGVRGVFAASGGCIFPYKGACVWAFVWVCMCVCVCVCVCLGSEMFNDVCEQNTHTHTHTHYAGTETLAYTHVQHTQHLFISFRPPTSHEASIQIGSFWTRKCVAFVVFAV